VRRGSACRVGSCPDEFRQGLTVALCSSLNLTRRSQGEPDGHRPGFPRGFTRSRPPSFHPDVQSPPFGFSPPDRFIKIGLDFGLGSGMKLLVLKGRFESIQLLGQDSPRFLVFMVTNAEGCNGPDGILFAHLKDHPVRPTHVWWELPLEDMPPGVDLGGIDLCGMGFGKNPLYKFCTYFRTLCLVLAEMARVLRFQRISISTSG